MMQVSLSLGLLASAQLRFDVLTEVQSIPPLVSVPIGIASLALLLALWLRLRRLPSDLRAKKDPCLAPIQLEELMMANPPQIIDLRPREEYQGKKGHIRGAINMPITEFRRRIPELDTKHPRPIVLVDETDLISHEAMPLLTQHGHRWVYVLRGGFRAWREARLPVYTVGEPKH